MSKKGIEGSKVFAIILAILVLTVTQMWAGGTREGGEAAREGKYSFAFVNPTMNNAFFVAIDGKFRELIEGDGHSYTMVSSDWDNSLQLSQMEEQVPHPYY